MTDKERLEAWNQALERTKHHDFDVSSNAYAELQNADLDMLAMLNRMQAEIARLQAEPAYPTPWAYEKACEVLRDCKAQLAAKDKLLVMARETMGRYFERYMQDEAHDVENCVCGREQHEDALAVKETLTALGEA